MKAYVSFKSIIIILIMVAGLLTCTLPGSGTEDSDDKTPPVVDTITPADGSLSAPVDTNIEIVFNESLDGLTMGTVTLNGTEYTDAINCEIEFDTTSDCKKIIINPDSSLSGETTYSIITVEGFKDKAGNLMAVYNNADYD